MDIEFAVLDVDWVLIDGKGVIRIWGKTEDGKTVAVFDRSLLPYFYVELNDDLKKSQVDGVIKRIKETKFKIAKIEWVVRKILGIERDFLKIVLENPRDVSKLRDVVKNWSEVKNEYEYGISFEKRYMVEKDIKPMEWYRVYGKEYKREYAKYADIAILAEKIEPTENKNVKLKVLVFDIEVYKDEIIMISFSSNTGFKKVITYGWEEESGKEIEILADEHNMLRRFVEIINKEDPDIIVTYNGDRFDWLRIKDKTTRLGIDLRIGRDNSSLAFVRRMRMSSAKIAGRIHVDLYDFVSNILAPHLSSEILSLDMVAKELLGIGKKSLEWRDIENIWREKSDLKKLADYCLNDSIITLKLAEKLLINIFELSKIVGQNIFDITRMAYSQLVEWLLIKKAYEQNEIILNRPKYDEIKIRREQEPYTGGYVYEPIPGIHKNIAVFDFKGLYPSIIVTFNISPETLDKKGKRIVKVPDEEHFFNLEQEGFVPSVVKELIMKRKDVKKMMESVNKDETEYKILDGRQFALKVIANASYGYYAYAGARWYSRICAKCITSFGRYYIRKVIDIAKSKGMNVIYGDTDSLFISDMNEKKAKNFLDEINNLLPGIMELEFEGMYKYGIFVHTKTGRSAKKRYAMIDFHGNIVVRGFEKVRRDWSNLAKLTQDKVIEAVLRYNNVEMAIDTVRKIINKLRKGEVDKKDLIIYTQITKPLDEYEQNAPHVIAARKYMARGNPVTEGDVIGYIITKGTGSIAERAEPYEYANNYDEEYYIHNQILPAALRVLHIFGVDEKTILESGKKQSSLASFFK